MIYVRQGVKGNKMKRVSSNDWQYIWKYEPETITTENEKEVKTYKENKATYFLSGELKGVRSNENLKTKNFIVIDYDDVTMLLTKFQKTVKDKLLKYGYILFPTINHNIKGSRFRLIINTDRPYTESENAKLLQNVIDYIGIPSDSASKTYSQLMGLPIVTPYSSEKLIIRNEGQPLKVDDWLFEPKKQLQKVSSQSSGILDNSEAIILITNYASKNANWLSDYSNYIIAYNAVRYAIQSGEIDQDTAEACLMILACGNGDWELDNVQKFRNDKSESRLDKPFRDFFGGVATNHNDLKNKPGFSNNNLKFILIERRQKELAEMEAEWELNGSKGKKPFVLSTLKCALILKEYIHFILFDSEENTRLAMYLPIEGIYTQNETLIKRYIGWLEPNHAENKANEIIYHIWKDADIQEKTFSRYLIPVKNGVFNLKTKMLEPFTPDYVFTSKIATAYVENPPLPILEEWNIENWMREIANGDEQVTTLLWQVISDAINGNYSRRKSIWLVGDGSNGKGTYQELLHNLIGTKNIATLKINQFNERFKLALLLEKVCCIGDDVQSGIYIDDSSEFNSVVTGETILIEIKNKMPYSAKLFLTVIQSTNGMPKIRNKTNGTYRRLIIVPFNAKFEGKNDVWKIKDEYIKSKDVLEYILYKAINMDFEQFTVPDVSKELLKEYRRENDPLVEFKETVFDEYQVCKIPFYIVYSEYKVFCEENNFKPLSKIKFSKEFTNLLGDKWENKKARYYVGDLGRTQFYSYVDMPKVGDTYQQFVRNDLKLLG